MAERIERPAPQGSDDDLQILHPHQELLVGERQITVREYSFVEGLRLRATAKPFLDHLAALIADGADLALAVLEGAIADNLDTVLELVAASADVEQSWIEQLSDADGELLLLTWWGVCGPFFVRALRRRVMSGRVEAAVRGRAGATSTPHSSPTATPQTDSATTPSDS